MKWKPLALLALLAWQICAPTAPAQPRDTQKDDEKTLRDVGIAVQGPAVLDYFKKRILPESDSKELAKLVRDLVHEEFSVREQAQGRLAQLGAAALTALKEVENDPSVELRKRVGDLRKRIDAKAETGVQIAAARQIARVKPAGATEVLLAYLPFAADSAILDELARALGVVGVEQGKVDPRLLEAQSDKNWLKRSIAGEVVVRSKVAQHLPDAKKLLADPDPNVRLRVGLAFASLRDREVLPVLVDLMAELPPESLWQVEEILVRLAGEKAPNVSLGTNPTSRKAARDAWQEWLAPNLAKLDLAKLEEAEPLLGYTLLVQQSINVNPGIPRRAGGLVMEVDMTKSVKWKFEVPTYPVDAQVVGVNRVLIAEYQGGKISERNFKGEVLWEKQVGGNPIGVQRMPNGNLFVVTQNRVAEFTREGEQVFAVDHPSHDLMRARKLRNGDIITITNTGRLTRLDSKTKGVLKQFQVQPMQALFGSIDVTPSGTVLVPEFQSNRVTEYDMNGKQVKTFAFQWPNSAVRLPNGHTLICSQTARRVVEFDRDGREVWQYQSDGSVFNARRR